MFENCTAKYNQFISGINDSVIITYPADENGMSKTLCVPMDENNTDYAEILRQVKEEGLTIKDAD
tara:strand:- start:508 stop:702 length:195 start_codon:yes stop_codon:yes gene_type:complete